MQARATASRMSALCASAPGAGMTSKIEVRIAARSDVFRGALRADDEDAPRRVIAGARVKRGEQRRDEVAAGDERQRQPVEPRQRPHDAAVAQRQPGGAVDRQQPFRLVVRR